MPTEKLRNVFSRARNLRSVVPDIHIDEVFVPIAVGHLPPIPSIPAGNIRNGPAARHRIVVTRLIVEKHGRHLVVAAHTERTRIIDFGFDIPVPITPIIVFRIIQRLIFAIIGCSLRGRNVNDGLIVIRISLWFGRIFKIRFIISPLIFLPPSIGSTAFR